jgi:hypothetical protein
MERQALPQLVEAWSHGVVRPGARLGRYELLVPVGYGGMACVWAARLVGRRGFSKLVAIKTILPHLAHNPDFEKMLLDEARIAASVHHPNVCDLYELGEQEGVLYLAIEWVDGDSLLRVIRARSGVATRALDPRLAARVAADACAGLHAVHELTDDFGQPLHVVHRDVSPHNILVSLQGVVKVTDFGVAKARGQLHQTTHPGEVKGKLAYMSPEQVVGASVDRRADIYSLGCVLYEMTMGKPPFRAEHDAHLLQAVLGGKYETLNFVAQNEPALRHIIEKALAPRPDERFGTADEMRTALEEWLAGSGPVVSATRVGGVLAERLGSEIEKRRERVRMAMSEALGSTRPVAQGMPNPRAESPAAGTDAEGTATGSAAATVLRHRSGIVTTSPIVSAETSPPSADAADPLPIVTVVDGPSVALPLPLPPPRLPAPRTTPASGARRAFGVTAAVVIVVMALGLGRLAVDWSARATPRGVDVTVESAAQRSPAGGQASSRSPTAPPLDLAGGVVPAPHPAPSVMPPILISVDQLPSSKPNSIAPATRVAPVRAPTHASEIPANPY